MANEGFLPAELIVHCKSLQRMGYYANALDIFMTITTAGHEEELRSLKEELRMSCKQAKGGGIDQIKLQKAKREATFMQPTSDSKIPDFVSSLVKRKPSSGLYVDEDVPAGQLLLSLNSVATTKLVHPNPSDEEVKRHRDQILKAAIDNPRIGALIVEMQDKHSSRIPPGGHILQQIPAAIKKQEDLQVLLESMVIFTSERSFDLVLWPLASIILRSCSPNTAATLVRGYEGEVLNYKAVKDGEVFTLLVRSAKDLRKGEVLRICNPLVSPLDKYAHRSRYAPFCFCEICRLELKCSKYLSLKPPVNEDEEEEDEIIINLDDARRVQRAIADVELQLSEREQQLLQCIYVNAFLTLDSVAPKGLLYQRPSIPRDVLARAVLEHGVGGFLDQKLWYVSEQLAPYISIERLCNIWLGEKHGKAFYQMNFNKKKK